ncbi:response regulator [Flavobacterium sp.]|uniref:response regulator n=1 Tax=Flavobacterium sp. TaxID=239 RepID=UPI003528EA45
MIRIAIAEDHQAVIDGIKLLLKHEENIEIIGTVNDGEALLELVKHKEPHIVITDIRMPKIDGIQLTKILSETKPHIKTLAFSMFDQQEIINKMITAGAKGYILKNASLKTIINAINEIYAGKTYFDVIVNNNKPNKPAENILTKRQIEILKLIAQGKTSRQISEELYIGISTVETHRKNMTRMLNLKGNGELLRYAIEKKYNF